MIERLWRNAAVDALTTCTARVGEAAAVAHVQQQLILFHGFFVVSVAIDDDVTEVIVSVSLPGRTSLVHG